jgi:hypothetical protein
MREPCRVVRRLLSTDDMRKRNWLLAAMMGLVACGSDGSQPPGVVGVTVVVGEDRLAIAHVDPSARAPLARARDGVSFLEYQLLDGAGEVVVSGRVPDPRWVHAEWRDEDTGEPRRREFLARAGSISLRLPAVAGELVMSELTAAGPVELGRTAFDPTQASSNTTARLSLAPDDDGVRGVPKRIAGPGMYPYTVDILFLPEAYTEGQLGEFHALTDSYAANMFKPGEAFADYADQINLWRLDVVSEDDDIDDEGGCNPFGGSHHDSYFDGQWGGGCFEGATANTVSYSFDGYVKAIVLAAELGADAVVMVANVEGIRAMAPDNGFVSMGRDDGYLTLAHELGHALIGLGDEYAESGGWVDGARCSTQSFFGAHERVNVQSDVDGLPWEDLLTPGVELPTEPGVARDVVGAFEGAGHCESNWYRPQQRCAMRSQWEQHYFCKVCRRELDRKMAELREENPRPDCPEEWRDDYICDSCLGDDPDCMRCNRNGSCEPSSVGGENCGNCPEDCGACSGCGDGVCDGDETDTGCPLDCGCASQEFLCSSPEPTSFGCFCDERCELEHDCCADADYTCPGW